MLSGKTAILIHGRHLQTAGWEDIMWGDPDSGRFGQIPTALKLVREFNPELIYWGTAGSSKDGVVESQYTFNYAIAHAGELSEFAGLDAYEIEAMLKQRSFIDLETQNTTREIHKAFEVCSERGIATLILVSAPTHIARCLQEALKLLETGKFPGLNVFAAGSSVPFAGYSAADVVVIEPPHRGDMPAYQTQQYAKAMFGIMRQGEAAFADYLEEWGELLTRHGIRVNWDPIAK